MGFFEKTVGDGFFQKVEIMFGTELNILSLFIPLTLTLSPVGERRECGKTPKRF
jgi:hypothetical protein